MASETRHGPDEQAHHQQPTDSHGAHVFSFPDCTVRKFPAAMAAGESFLKPFWHASLSIIVR